MFIDKAKVKLKAGDGGRGMVSFRTEKYIDKGGPDGGDGGDGGSIIFVGHHNISTLLDFKYNYIISAEPGGNGFRRNQHGRNGEDKILNVPLGTQVFSGGELLVDIKDDGQQFIVARGGQGGFGNAHFKTSTRQAPRVAEKGEPGQELEIELELKAIADVGLVGLPNAGKSTFLSVTSNAKPEIADYQFTTLKPNIGVAKVGSGGIFIADIPGLIEGAHKGKGLGDEFLRHVERTAVILHLIDSTSQDIVKDCETITSELEHYPKLNITKKPQIVVLTKTDLADQEWLDYQKKLLNKATKLKIYDISSQNHKNIDSLLKTILKMVEDERAKQKIIDEEEQSAEQSELTTLSLSQKDDEEVWSVELDKKGIFNISGKKIELFVNKTDFDNNFSKERLKDIMAKMGIMHKLFRMGYVQNESTLKCAGIKFNFNDEWE